MHFGQVMLSSVNEKGKTLNLKRYLLSTHHGVFTKYRKAFLAEFAYCFHRRYWLNQAFDRLVEIGVGEQLLLMYLGPCGVVQSSKPNIREYCSLTPFYYNTL